MGRKWGAPSAFDQPAARPLLAFLLGFPLCCVELMKRQRYAFIEDDSIFTYVQGHPIICLSALSPFPLLPPLFPLPAHSRVGDYAVVRYRIKGRAKIKIPGRLKVSSRSLVFDPVGDVSQVRLRVLHDLFLPPSLPPWMGSSSSPVRVSVR